MALFRRRDRSGDGAVAPDVGRFWSWWGNVSGEVAQAVDAGAQQRVRALVEPRVHELDRRLSWHVGAGVEAPYMLVVTGRRDPALRPVTERWWRAAPSGAQMWEYHPAAPAQPAAFSGRVMVDGREIEPAQSMAGAHVDDVGCRLNLTVFHSAL